MKKEYFLDFDVKRIEDEILEMGENKFRSGQIIEWVYKKRIESFLKCSNLPPALREVLENKYCLRSLTLKGTKVSKVDGTARYHFVTSDGQNIFAVYLPGHDRNSICLSTQVGCPVKCSFCYSGKIKFVRNLTRGEILEQIMQIEKEKKVRISSVLFMGMGEPLLNYNNVVSAIRSLTDFKQFGLGRTHVTLSTVGVVPLIRKLAQEELGIRLALSLHAADDKIRKKLIDSDACFSVKDVLGAGLYFSRKNNSRLTVEYMLIAGLNDSPEDAEKFIKLLDRSASPKDEIQVNLIPFNDTKVDDLSAPSYEIIERFKHYLAKNGVLAMVRWPKGADIGSACGQLGI